MVLTNVLAIAWTGIGIVGIGFQLWIFRRARDDRQYSLSQRLDAKTVLLAQFHLRTAIGRLYVVLGNAVFGVLVLVHTALIGWGRATPGDSFGLFIGAFLSIHLVISETILVWLGYVDIDLRKKVDGYPE